MTPVIKPSDPDPLIPTAPGLSATSATGRPGWLVSGRVPCLDGLRAIAILMVILSHLGTQLPQAVSRLSVKGHLGVECFFVISGFLITLLLIREHERFGTISIKEFYVRRFLRILPACTVYLACIYLLTLIAPVHIGPQYWAAALTYTMCYAPHLNHAWDIGHTWSLSVEEHFYFIWPFLFCWLRPRRAMNIVLIYIALTPILRYIIWSRLSALMDIDFCSVTQMSSIATGCLLAFICTGYGLPALEVMIRKRPGTIFLLGIATLILSQIAQRSGKFGILLGDPVNAAGFALIIVGALYSDRSIISRILNTKPLVVIGILSYSLYLWQEPFTSPQAHAFAWPANVAFIIIAACLSCFFVERPFLRWKARRKQMHPEDGTPHS